MATLTSQEILNATVSMGVSKANQCWIARAANTLLAGMYIAIGGFLAIRIGLALPWEQWGGMSKLIFGAVFPLGLMLVVLCGADLFTGSCMTLATAQAKQKISFGQTVFTLATSWLGNFAGFTEALLRGVGCNWLVCLAVFAAAASTETIGKIAALWFPTMAFVALGMEHCIANMFFIPLGILTGTDPRYIALVEAGKAAALKADFYSFAVGNLIPVTIGNIVGGSVLVGMLYLAANIKKA